MPLPFNEFVLTEQFSGRRSRASLTNGPGSNRRVLGGLAADSCRVAASRLGLRKRRPAIEGDGRPKPTQERGIRSFS